MHSKYTLSPLAKLSSGYDSSKDWRMLVAQKDYSQVKKIICEKQSVDVPTPKSFPKACGEFLSVFSGSYEFPPIYISEIINGTANGDTNLIITDSAVIHHDLYDFNRDTTSEEFFGRHVIDSKKNRIKILNIDNKPQHLTCAASFVDAVAFNYAHWLTEILPRISVFCAQEEFTSVPLIVNAGLHPNIMESLLSICGDQRIIYTLAPGRGVKVDKLYMVSACGYVPYEFRTRNNEYLYPGMFSPYALGLVRENILKTEKESNYTALSDKVFLKRNSAGKQAVNFPAVYNILKTNRYQFVSPETLSFINQVALFNKSKIIIGSSGASIANVIFAGDDTKIIILIGTSKKVSYGYWQRIARACGKDVIYVLGEVPITDKSSNQPSFIVPIEGLTEAASLVVQAAVEPNIIICGQGHGIHCVYDGLRNKGRKFALCTQDPEIISLANKDGIDVYTDYNQFIKNPSDIVLTAAYKPTITEQDLLKARFINIHYGLLPRYRGMHAVVWSLINGEQEVGFTIHETSKLLDQGDVIYQEAIPVKDYNSWELMLMLDKCVENCVDRVIQQYIAGEISPKPQVEKDAIYVAPRNMEDCRVRWNEWDVVMFGRLLRALVPPYPRPYFTYKEDRIEIVKATAIARDYIEINGHVVYVDDKYVYVKINGGLLRIETIKVNDTEMPANEHFKRIGIRFT